MLGLFVKGWTVAQGMDAFYAVTQRCFGQEPGNRRSMMSRINHYVRGLVSDGCYDAKGLEEVLRESFGRSTALFGYPKGGVSGAKVAVIATTISNALSFVFSNYNGAYREKRPRGQ